MDGKQIVLRTILTFALVLGLSVAREQATGPAGAAESKAPAGFETWSTPRKIAFLTHALEEVEVPQPFGFPIIAGIDFAEDWRVAALIELGDAAVPALIDVIETDERVTRTVHDWMDRMGRRHVTTVHGVREPALIALMSILRVPFFEAERPEDNFTLRGPAYAKELAGKLRAYWREFGHLPLDERMMKVLTDPKSSAADRRRAAHDLGYLGYREILSSTYNTSRLDEQPTKSNPAATKFKNPTAAEAILAGLIREFTSHGQTSPEWKSDSSSEDVEDGYLKPLIALGDQRIAPRLAELYRTSDGWHMRRKWAFAAHRLGSSEPIKDLAKEFQRGAVTERLGGVIGDFVLAGLPECEAALDALGDPEHPQHVLVAPEVLSRRSDRFPWKSHRFCIEILRRELDNETRTGGVFTFDRGTVTLRGGSALLFEKTGFGHLSDQRTRRDAAPERRCDQAAEILQSIVYALPEYHALYRDSDERLRTVKAFIDKYSGSFRRLTTQETRLLRAGDGWSEPFVPCFRPLGRSATAEDVGKGRAIFHLDGKGKPVPLELPAIATLAAAKSWQREIKLLVLQAEETLDGEVHYGVVGFGEIRRAKASELTDITTVAKYDEKAKSTTKPAAK